MGIPQWGINGQGFNWFPALFLGFMVHGNGVHGHLVEWVEGVEGVVGHAVMACNSAVERARG